MVCKSQVDLTGRFKIRDTGLLYVSPCSDVDASLEYNRRFLECQVMNILPPWDEDTDYRYMVYCAEKLRDHKVLNGAREREALVSVNSLFLLTWEEFGNMRSNSDVLIQKIKKIEAVFKNRKVEPHLRNWQREHLRIMEELNYTAKDVIEIIKSDLTSLDTRVVLF